jgi:hypothetical protein
MGVDVNEVNIVCKHCDSYKNTRSRCELNKNPYEGGKECDEALAKALAELQLQCKPAPQPKSKYAASKRNWKRGKLRKRQTAVRKQTG